MNLCNQFTSIAPLRRLVTYLAKGRYHVLSDLGREAMSGEMVCGGIGEARGWS
jgi:hypothetical protein